MRVGFLNNQIDNRGTGNALYQYAHYNEEILGNESIILVPAFNLSTDRGMELRLRKRFNHIWPLVQAPLSLDFVYHIKYGNNDGWVVNVPYGVHAVFDPSQPHGDKYATVSDWMGTKYNVPSVPHIIELAAPTHDLRSELHIPDGARVFGRHGGPDTFDIPWVWEAINSAMDKDESIYCIFLNTKQPDIPLAYPERFRFMENTSDREILSSFIHACDAMVHARSRGETFGIACGEFAKAGRPVLTYGGSPERAHIDQLRGLGYQYFDTEELVNQLLTVNKPSIRDITKYDVYTPEYIMARFKRVFLT